MSQRTGGASDPITQAWIRNPSDEAAVKNGCRFDVDRAAFVVTWIETYCKLYEGEWAGQPLMLRGCLDCGYDLDPEIDHLERARRHCECVAAGHAVDWQYECVMRLFGWVRWSAKWQREVRRFRQATIYVCKKNKKTPTVSAIGLYLLIGDGEPGQKVYPAAKDGSQVRELIGKHVLEMVKASPELSSCCSVNKTTMEIRHEPSKSTLKPLSSSNERTQQSKEGLNGSVILDELHVVDASLVGRISRAGISRSEPLQIEVSTAGNNPDGYGKQRFDRAVSVLKGDIEDEQLFAAVYAAPQDLSDADLEADPLKWGRMANPAMGHTVDPEEYLHDYRTSKTTSLTEFIRFKMYRLNVWAHSESPWLEAGDWEQCRDDFTEDDMEGRVCIAGLDLSRVCDMSALVLCFPWDDDEFRLLPYFWLPHDEAHRRSGVVPYLQWAKEGLLHLTPGNVIDYGFIKATIRKLARRFSIRSIHYDPWHANELTQDLEQGQQDDAGKVIEEGLGITRVPFKQGIASFSGPCKDFERLVKAKKIRHNGHKILTWQAGHVQVYRDANDNLRPVKPKGGHKKIDGVVASIMAVAGSMERPAPPTGKFYETHGLEMG